MMVRNINITARRLVQTLVLLSVLSILALPSSFAARPVAAQGPVIHAVLFFSPTCPHCHEVMENVLPPLVAQFPKQLDIAGVDVSQPIGSALYQAFLSQFQVPDDRVGVPTLVVGDQVLVGSQEIPDQFPGLIEKGLASGGVDWPAIPGLQKILASQPPASSGAELASAQPAPPAQTGPLDLFKQDPLANTIAVIVLLFMLAAVILVASAYARGSNSRLFQWPAFALPLLSLVGMGVAGYLSYTYLSHTEVVCGPVGNCGDVQNSPYAYLFGVIPVGLLGLLGYAGILTAWLLRQYGPVAWHKLLSIAIWGMAWFGVLFTIYLTFLEPFVIGASCAWCLTSAALMTLVFLASTGPALQALKIESGESDDDFDDLEDRVTPA
jgi:uncharacterized membrane protein/thiol-disulfide isomerase/thioredoxin